MIFLRNAWYMAAWADEVTHGELFSRVLLNESILFYRLEDGSVAAISNCCPHRFAPLSMGTQCGNAVRCAYHGLEFDYTGACTHNPHGDGKIPAAARVKIYPAVERYLAIWVWMGNPALADPDLIPDYSFLSDAKPTARNTGYLHSTCNYQLLCDNIMDLSHVDFLHPATLGGGALSRVGGEVSELAGGRVSILWEAKNEVAPPAFGAHLPDPSAPADVWSSVVWSAPSLMHLSAGATTSGASYADGVSSSNLHIMTPESEFTTHYFFANTRSFLQDDAEFNQFIDKVLVGVFANEDKPMVEGQQQLMGTDEFWSLKPLLLPGDAGAIRARRALDRLIAQEQNSNKLNN